jgi:hypothetical protein
MLKQQNGNTRERRRQKNYQPKQNAERKHHNQSKPSGLSAGSGQSTKQI